MNLSIIGPNLRDQSKGTFHVHAQGCLDITRDPNYAGLEPWNIEASQFDEVGDFIYADHIAEGSMKPGDGTHDCHFLPCCAKELS